MEDRMFGALVALFLFFPVCFSATYPRVAALSREVVGEVRIGPSSSAHALRWTLLTDRGMRARRGRRSTIRLRSTRLLLPSLSNAQDA